MSRRHGAAQRQYRGREEQKKYRRGEKTGAGGEKGETSGEGRHSGGSIVRNMDSEASEAKTGGENRGEGGREKKNGGGAGGLAIKKRLWDKAVHRVPKACFTYERRAVRDYCCAGAAASAPGSGAEGSSTSSSEYSLK